METLRVLLAGESWVTYSVHVKGANIYTGGTYQEGHTPLADAFSKTGVDLTYIPNHLVTAEFPFQPEDLTTYDAVILSDVGSDTFLLHPDTFVRSKATPNRLHSIREYVRKGGGFAMVGGYMSFSGFEGKARYGETAIEDILPVQIRGWDDRIEAPQGVIPSVVGNSDHPILSGISGQWPLFLGYNRLRAKAEGNLILQVDGDPFLVTGTYGKGRTLAFASDCSPHWGPPEFTSWDHYPRFWHQAVQWLAGRIG